MINQPEPSLREQIIMLKTSDNYLDRDGNISIYEHSIEDILKPADLDTIMTLFQADKEAAVKAEREWALDNANKMTSGIWNPELGVIAAEQRVKQLTHTKPLSDQEVTQVSLCSTCNSITHTRDGVCTRCGELKTNKDKEQS